MKIILFCLGNILYAISYVIPKSSKIWIFGSWGGGEFADNPKYFYNYIKEKQPKIKRIWLTRNKALCEKLKKEGHNIFMCNSFSGIWYSCRAQIGIVSPANHRSWCHVLRSTRPRFPLFLALRPSHISQVPRFPPRLGSWDVSLEMSTDGRGCPL